MFGDEEGMELDINVTSQQWIVFNVNQVGGFQINCYSIKPTYSVTGFFQILMNYFELTRIL